MTEERQPDPLHVFRFRVDFQESQGKVPLCSGQFSECSGLEATMEPHVIKVGGRNFGAVQRAGRVTFGTVILKRGITATQHLWQWFDFVTRSNAYAYRLTATITIQDAAGRPRLTWELTNVLPTKFKVPDLNATAREVGVEELHLVHEGMKLIAPGGNP